MLVKVSSLLQSGYFCVDLVNSCNFQEKIFSKYTLLVAGCVGKNELFVYIWNFHANSRKIFFNELEPTLDWGMGAVGEHKFSLQISGHFMQLSQNRVN